MSWRHAVPHERHVLSRCIRSWVTVHNQRHVKSNTCKLAQAAACAHRQPPPQHRMALQLCCAAQRVPCLHGCKPMRLMQLADAQCQGPSPRLRSMPSITHAVVFPNPKSLTSRAARPKSRQQAPQPFREFRCRLQGPSPCSKLKALAASPAALHALGCSTFTVSLLSPTGCTLPRRPTCPGTQPNRLKATCRATRCLMHQAERCHRLPGTAGDG